MIYTNEEAAMIDGMIGTLFGGANVARRISDRPSSSHGGLVRSEGPQPHLGSS